MFLQPRIGLGMLVSGVAGGNPANGQCLWGFPVYLLQEAQGPRKPNPSIAQACWLPCRIRILITRPRACAIADP